MKTMLVKSSVLAMASVGLLVGNSLATPIFNGDPTADYGTAFTTERDNLNYLSQSATVAGTGPGYYIWANDDSRTSWSVRWTGGDWTNGWNEVNNEYHAKTYGSYDWYGQITYTNSDGIQDFNLVAWETNDDGTVTLTNAGNGDYLSLDKAVAGPYWDGFDFTLTGMAGDYLTFNIGGTYFASDNDGIYLGQSFDSILANSDSTAGFRNALGNSRQFEVAAPVPEPATMLLFGTGLAGLAGLGRRKKKE